MKERLFIKNFGPIREADLTFGRFNVLIGEQATGKSTVAKLLALFGNLNFLLGSDISRYREQDRYSLPFEEDTDILFQSGNFHIVYLKGKFTVNAIGRHKLQLERLIELYSKVFSGLTKIEGDEISKLDDWYLAEIGITTYVPAERVFAGYLADVNSILRSDPKIMDYFINLNAARKNVNRLPIPHLKNVNYVYENDLDKVSVNGRTFLLSNSSSGFQSSIPIVVMISGLAELPNKDFFIIEEPELNLFPTAQNELMKFLVDKTMNYGNTMLIATHSPYVLASLNNLMSAYESGKKDKEATARIISGQYWLNHSDVSAYKLLPDGTCEDIFDREEGLIKSEEIDTVSSIINHQFDELLNIQFWQQ